MILAEFQSVLHGSSRKSGCCANFLLNREKSRCLYLILYVGLAARSSKHLSWEAASRNARSAKAATCKSRCQFLRIGAVVILPHQAVRAAVRVVPVVRAQAAVHVIKEV
ncbi:MAG TPA: hypothetical protein VJ988_01225 [Desulfobulbales bacterium]|jgi:hypothetical protein|nr:hypothetical protein [Desulfobulbales bacterium]